MSISHTSLTEVNWKLYDQALRRGINIDISKLEEHLAREDYGAIIKDPELFFLAFLKALSRVQQEYFPVSIKGNTLTISGRGGLLEGEKYSIEEIRQRFLEGYEDEEGFTILPIANLETPLRFKTKSSIINIEWSSGGSTLFREIIKPCMSILSQSLGAVCYEVEIVQKIKYMRTGETKEEKINAC